MNFCAGVYQGLVSDKQEKQIQNDIRLALNKVVIKHLANQFFLATPTNFVHLYSIKIAFAKAGKIQEVYFPSEVSNDTNKTIRLDTLLIIKLKSLNFTHKQYASKRVLIPFFIIEPPTRG